jgi:nucleoside 2-deoxyribosyltransferase
MADKEPPSKGKRCYVASPCGFAESTDLWYKTKLLPQLSKLVQVVDPWDEDVSHILKMPVEQRHRLWVGLGMKHYGTIETCDLVVAILDQEPPDNGTVCEVAHAASLPIPVFAYRGDTRSSGEEGVPVNLMILAAIDRSGGTLTTELDDLIETVDNHVNSSPPR